jgi:hypothetical protein
MYIEKDCKSTIKTSCDCGEIEMEVTKWKDDSDLYFLDFKISAFYSGQSIIGIIKERIKLAWLSLRKGNYYFQNMEMNKEALKELKDDLNKMFKD